MKTPDICPECGEECKPKSCKCGWKINPSKFSNKEKQAYGRFCQQVRDFFSTVKGRELKAESDANGKAVSLAIKQGEAITVNHPWITFDLPKVLQEIQKTWSDGDCGCEAGIIFYNGSQRYFVGRCDICRDPRRPEDTYKVKKWEMCK